MPYSWLNRIGIVAVLLGLALVVLSAAGCSPSAKSVQDQVNGTGTPGPLPGRVRALSVQQFTDGQGHAQYIMVLEDTATSRQVIAVTGAAVVDDGTRNPETTPAHP